MEGSNQTELKMEIGNRLLFRASTSEELDYIFSSSCQSFTPDHEMRDLLTGKNISGEEILPVNGVMVLEEI